MSRIVSAFTIAMIASLASIGYGQQGQTQQGQQGRGQTQGRQGQNQQGQQPTQGRPSQELYQNWLDRVQGQQGGVCASGVRVPDLGYGLAACRDCVTFALRNGTYMQRFSREPALYQIRANGPAAGKLFEGDTLVSVDGQAITTEAAALRLAEYRSGSIPLQIRRNGATIGVVITPLPVCVAGASGAAPNLQRRIRLSQDTSSLLVADRIILNHSMLDTALRHRLTEVITSDRLHAVDIRTNQLMLVADRIVMAPPGSLGVGLICGDCALEQLRGGGGRWTFSTNPVVGDVQPGGVADRLGLRAGDTLTTIDDLALTSRAGGERLGSLTPGATVKLGWRHAGVAETATVTLDQRDAVPSGSANRVRLAQPIGNSRVEVRGNGVQWSRDPQTGALIIRTDSATIRIVPPPK